MTQKALSALKRVLAIGFAWAIVWLAFWMIIVAIIAIVDPDSVDPGEPMMAVAIFGSMGLCGGVAFAVLLSVSRRGPTGSDPSPMQVAAWGILGAAIGQLPYLGHGDLGLAANIRMALLFSILGGVVTIVWLAIARAWSRRRSKSLMA